MSDLIVEMGNIVTVSYELRDTNGQLIERMDINYPFKFYFGNEKLLPDFEAGLANKSEQEQFEFTIPAERAYGQVEQGNILDLDRKVFKDQGLDDANTMIAGNFIQLTDDEGDVHQGRLMSIGTEKVKVDFNHALAGKDLHFKGTILNIRKATLDETIRKQYIEEDGIHQ
ncbi:MAG: FKBP-type peptidyl-prolyl cis-trans isomerase [Bacteroidota bacterium]